MRLRDTKEKMGDGLGSRYQTGCDGFAALLMKDPLFHLLEKSQ